MSDDPIRESRRAIDLYTADQFARMDERLATLRADVGDLKEVVNGSHGEPGLAEKVRGIVKMWGFIIGGLTLVISWFPWIYDHFIADTAKRPVFGEEVRERWIKESTKRIRMFNKELGRWEYFYAIEEVRDNPGR